MKTKVFSKFIAIAIAIAMVLSCTSCAFIDGFIGAFWKSGNDSEPTTTVPKVEIDPCEHEIDGEGVIVNIDGEYYLQHVCSKCGENVNQEANVTSYSDKWLYDENQHWHNAACEEAVDNAPDVHKTKNYKGEVAEHTFDENGVCSGCSYKNVASEGLVFEDNEDETGYILTGIGECRDSHVNVPSHHNNKPVVGIGDNAFNTSRDDEDEEGDDDEKQVIVGITIPDTVIYISCTALADCENLVNFIVDSENEVYEAINNCLIDTSLGSIVRGCEFSIIPEDGSVTIIGSYAFANSEGLVSITIPDTVTELGDKAFLECDALVEVTMPENINIGVDVFRGSIHVEIKVEHTLVYVPAKEATCYEAGNIEHFICSDCGNFYADQGASERIYEVSIPAAHNFVDGVCTSCGMVMNEILIVAIDQIPDLGKFPLGTLENAIGLPEKVNVYTADGVKHELDVKWDLSTYNKSEVGIYTISGVIQSGNYRYAEGLTNIISASIEIVEFMKGTADIVFILDISGSMGDEINNVKNNIVAFAAAIEAQGVSARWSAVTFSDFTVSGENEESIVVKNGAADWFISAEEYKSAINGISLAYGGDGPETGVDGMMLAKTALSTRQDARVFYILLTDADCKVTNNYEVESLEHCADILAEDSINVSVITTTDLFYHYSYLSETTGGIQSNIYGNFSQDLLDTLVPIIYGEVIS